MMDFIKQDLTVDEKILNIVKPFMIFCGLWSSDLIESKQKKILYHYYSSIIQFLYILWFLLMMADLIFAVKNGEPLSNVAIMISYSEMMTKFIILKKSKVSIFFAKVKNREKEIWSSRNERIIKAYTEKINLSRMINWSTIIVPGIVTSFFFIDGIIDDIKVKKFGKSDNYKPYRKMYPIWLPFDTRNQEAIVLTINFLIALSGLILYDTILMILVTYSSFLASQLRILQIKLSEATKYEDCFNVNGYLKKLILEHKELIRLVKGFSNSIKYVMLMEYLLNSVAVATIAIQILNADTVEEHVFLISFGITLYIHIFSLGWTANEVKIESINIADAVNEMDWYKENYDFKHMIYMLMLRARDPLVIELGPFAVMTIESALVAMKAAYSYLMVMKNF